MAPSRVEFDAAKIDAIFAALDQTRLPGAAVGIAIAGHPAYRRGFGLAHMDLPVALTPATKMRVASVTKHITALAYLLLCEDGKADLDDPVTCHLPDLHPVLQRVTARQLMAHTSGIRDVHDLCWQFGGGRRAVAATDLLALYRRIDELQAEPGATWLYSNGGYLLLSAMVERLAGVPLDRFMRQRIFEPAGMYDTMMRPWDRDFVAGSATLHATRVASPHHVISAQIAEPQQGFERAENVIEWSGEGGLVSTVDDMLRWLAHMDAPVVGSHRTWTTLRTPQLLHNGTSTGYGLGLFSGRYRGLDILFHAGGASGGNAFLLKAPAAKLDIVVQVNRADVYGMLLVDEIVEALVPGLDPTPVAPRNVAATGTFVSAQTNRVVQLFSQDGQQVASIDGFELPVERSGDGIYRPAGLFRHLQQSLHPGGDPAAPSTLRICDFGSWDELMRADAPRMPDAAICGTYVADAIAAEASIRQDGGGFRLHTSSSFGAAEFALEPLADRLWRARSTDISVGWTGGNLAFDQARTLFDISTVRTSKLRFRRCAP